MIREWTSTDAEEDVLESLICSVSLPALRRLFHIYTFTNIVCPQFPSYSLRYMEDHLLMLIIDSFLSIA